MEALLDLCEHTIENGRLDEASTHLATFRDEATTAPTDAALRKRAHDLANKLMIAQFRSLKGVAA